MIKYNKTKTNSITLQEVYDHTGTDSSDETILQRMLETATLNIEKWCGIEIIQTTVVATYKTYRDESISKVVLDIGNASKVDSLKINDNPLEEDKDFYVKLSSHSVEIEFSKQQKGALEITLSAGFTNMPEDLKNAILVRLSSLYDNERSEYNLTQEKYNAETIERLIFPYKYQ